MSSSTNDQLQMMEWLLIMRSRQLALDLLQCLDQQALTTKHGRREQALAHLLDVLTCGESHGRFRPSRWECERVLDLICRLQANVKGEPARIGLQRAEHRVRWLLDHPEEMADSSTCVACGEQFFGKSHGCTNLRSKMRDAAFSRDPDVTEVS